MFAAFCVFFRFLVYGVLVGGLEVTSMPFEVSFKVPCWSSECVASCAMEVHNWKKVFLNRDQTLFQVYFYSLSTSLQKGFHMRANLAEVQMQQVSRCQKVFESSKLIYVFEGCLYDFKLFERSERERGRRS